MKVKLLGTSIAVASLMLASVGALAQSKDETVGSFHYVHKQDVFDDSDRSFVFTMPEDIANDRTAALTWRCLSDGLNVVYMHGTYYSGDSDSEILVRYRIDQNPASEYQYWGLFSDNKSSYIPMNQVNSFTKEAINGSMIHIEAVDPADGERVRDSFKLNGLGEAIKLLSCYTP